MMRALIVDSDHQGHHLQYVGVLAQGLIDVGAEVTLLLGKEAPASVEFATHLGKLATRVRVIPKLTPVKGDAASDWRATAEAAVRLIAAERADRVFFPYADGLAQAFQMPPACSGPLRRAVNEGLLMRGSFAYPKGSWGAWLRSRVSRHLVLSGPWRVLHLLDTLPYLALRGTGHVRSGRVRLIPEAVEPIHAVSPVDARLALGLPAEGRWLAVTGQQDVRKGSDRLLRAYLGADLPADARLLLAGKASTEFAELVRTEAADLVRQGRVVLIDRYLSESDHHLALCAADVVASPQPEAIGSSGVLVRAASLSKPLLASDFGWIGWATQTFRLGRTVKVDDPVAYSRTLSEVMRDAPVGGGLLAEKFNRYHTLSNHLAHWLADTRRELGLAPSPDLLRWEELFANEPFA